MAAAAAAEQAADEAAAAERQRDRAAHQERLDREAADALRESQAVAAEQAKQARLEHLRTCAPPASDAVDVTAAPSSAHRDLLYYGAWRDDVRRQLADLEAGATALAAEIGAPRATQAAIDRLVAEDTSGLLARLRKAGTGLLNNLRTVERAELEEKLAQDTHQAVVAREALKRAEAEIAELKEASAIIEGRHRSFVLAVIKEEGRAAVEAYIAAAEAAGGALQILSGLHSVGATVLDGYGTPSVDISLPAVVIDGELVTPAIKVSTIDVANWRNSWSERIRQLEKDPTSALRS
jgi:hypothetical protein